MTIDELLSAAGLTANDEIPIWDAEATGEPTKKITAQQLAAAVVSLANLVTGVKGNSEQNYRHGNVNLTPANIGAHPADTRLVVTNNTDYTGNTSASQPVVQIMDTSNFIRHQLYGLYGSNGGFYTYLAARKPDGSSAVTNQIAIGFDANGNGAYSISYPAEFRNAIGLGNVNNSLVLTTSDNTLAKIYAKLNAMPITPDRGAGVPCWISAAAMNLLTGGKTTSSELHGIITKTSSTGYRIFGMYGATGYMLYWSVTVTSSAITPNTVYKLQGTAM